MQKKILIKDRLYGAHQITEPVIIELLRSKSVQRLKRINQFGIPDKYYHLKNFSRFEHSVGVMILIKTLGGSLEEQVAGLLHDVSHTAFSHIIDWVLGSSVKETYQDDRHEDMINSGEISRILKKYHYRPAQIADYHNFKLLERDIPDLCADRVDYSLREFPARIAQSLYPTLINYNNKIIFKDQRSARLFARNFLKLQKEHWGGFEAVSRYKLFSNALRIALKEGLIHTADFLNDDQYIIKKLSRVKDTRAKAILKLLEAKKLSLTKETEIVYKKFRYTDPEFLGGRGPKRLSSIDLKYKKYLEKQRIVNQKGIKVPIVNI